MRFFFSFCFLLFLGGLQSQEVISSVYLKEYTKDYLDGEFSISTKTSTDLYRITYTTTNVHGVIDTVSGLVCIPKTEGVAFPMLAYCHGTVGSRYEVASYESGEEVIPGVLSSLEIVVVAPDYLGLGYDQGIHPYVHADSEAWVSRDMIIAAKKWLLEEKDIQTNDQMFISGYSQGGHAAMALHRLLESEGNIEVSGALPMSGPYSISSGMRRLFLSNQSYPIVAYLVNVIIGYQEVYGNILPDGNLDSFFRSAYVEDIKKFKNGSIDLWELNDRLISKLEANHGAAFPKYLVREDVIMDILNDENHPVNVALRDNDVYDWAPVADTRLLYCEGDDQVSYLNSVIARDTMVANGAQHVKAINLNSAFNHTQCFRPAITVVFFYLTQFAKTSPLSATGEIKINHELSVYPTVSAGQVALELPQGMHRADIIVKDIFGQVVSRFTVSGQWSHNDLDLPSGVYFIGVEQSPLKYAKIFICQ